MLTENRTYGTPARVGRKKEFPERITLPMEAGTSARIDAARAADEPRVDFIRQAIEREIKRRSKQKG